MTSTVIAGVRICSYSPFSSVKSIFVDFLFCSKRKIMTLWLNVHTIVIPGELSKAKNKLLNFLGPGNVLPWEILTEALLLATVSLLTA